MLWSECAKVWPLITFPLCFLFLSFFSLVYLSKPAASLWLWPPPLELGIIFQGPDCKVLVFRAEVYLLVCISQWVRGSHSNNVMSSYKQLMDGGVIAEITFTPTDHQYAEKFSVLKKVFKDTWVFPLTMLFLFPDCALNTNCCCNY